MVLGCFLLTAAALKAHALWTDSAHSDTFFSSLRWQVALVELETLLGLWLLFGSWARPAWAVALGFFSILAGASLYMALQGQSSCGCFGRVQVNPWLTFGLDFAAVAALLLTWPVRASEDRPAPWLQALLRAAAGAAVLLGLIGVAFLLLSDDPAEALVRLRGDAVTVEPTVSQVGEGVAGEQRTFSIRVTNHHDQPVRIVGGTANSSCNATGGLPITISARGSLSLEVQGRFRGGPGFFRQDFVLYTDDARQPTVTAWFAGRVVAGRAPVQAQEGVVR